MTNTNVKLQPSNTTVALTEIEDIKADLEEARSQIATIKSERDTLANTINRLDIVVADLKDDLGKQQTINENMLTSFKDLYNQYQALYDQVISSNTALTITTGKLAESLVKYKFSIPQAEQQQS